MTNKKIDEMNVRSGRVYKENDKVVNEADLQERMKSPFDEMLSTQRTPIIQINGSFDISELRDIITETATATVTSVDSEYKLSLAAAGDKAIMESAARGRYTPGCAAEAGVGIRFEDEIVGDAVLYWGYFDTDTNDDIYNGAVYGKDSTGVFIALYRKGVEEHKVYQSSWNQNKDIDLTKGNVFQIRFTYYGYGLIEWRVLESKTGSDNQTVTTLHTYRPDGKPVLSNSNLRVGAMIYSTNDTTAYDLYLSGRQFSIIGKAEFKQRSISHLVSGVSVPTTGYVPLMTFRKKAGYEAVSIGIQTKSIITDNDLDLKWAVRVALDDATNWKNPSGATATETALEVNDDATAVTLGDEIFIYQSQAYGGSPNTTGTLNENLNITDLPDEYNVCLLAKAKATAATVDAIGTIVEER